MRSYLIYLLVLIGALISCYWLYTSNKDRMRNVTLIKHTLEVRYEIENIFTLEREVSTLFTAYRYKKDPSLLSPITIAQQKLHAEIGQLIFLTQDNPVQNERAKRIKKLSEIYFKLPLIDSVLALTVAAQQKASPQLKKLLTTLDREEQQLLTLGRSFIYVT